MTSSFRTEPTFRVEHKLLGYNEQQRIARGNYHAANKAKHEAEEAIGWAIVAAKVKRYTQPVHVHMVWHEAKARNGHYRDIDNIIAAQKYVLDAMTAQHVITDDSLDYVPEVSHKVIKDDRFGVDVYIDDIT